MVYKRYAKKNGKVYGPYFYESYRENGVVKKVYIGQKPAPNLVVPPKNFTFFGIFIFAIIALIVLAGSMSFKSTGIVTLEAQPIYNFGEILAGQVNLNIESGDFIQKDTQIKLTLSKDSVVLSETIKTFEEFLGDQISYVSITNDSLLCVNETIATEQEVCQNVTSPETTQEVCNLAPQEICHDETNENGTIQVCTTEDVQVCENVTTPGETSLNCSIQSVESQIENCTAINITDDYYQTPGVYSEDIQSLINYNLSESGEYSLEFSVPSLGVSDIEIFSVSSPISEPVESPIPEENVTASEENVTNETLPLKVPLSLGVAALVSTCTNLSSPDIYNLTGDLNNNGTCFVINASNVELDCAGFTITGNRTGFGIKISSHNVTVRNCNVRNFTTSIFADPDNVVIENSTFSGSTNGVVLQNSINGTVRNNVIFNNTANGILVNGTSTNNTIVNNTIFNNTLNGIFLSGSGVSLTNITQNTVTKVGSGAGIRFTSSGQNILSGNTVSTGTSAAVLLSAGGNSTVIGNFISSIDAEAIFLSSSNNNTLLSNIFGSNASSGIFLDSSHNNTIRNNRMNNTLFISTSDDNILDNNTASSSSFVAVQVDGNRNIFSNSTFNGIGFAGVSLFDGIQNRFEDNIIGSDSAFGLTIDSSSFYNSRAIFFRNNISSDSSIALELDGGSNNNFTNTTLLSNATWLSTGVGVNNSIEGTLFNALNGSIRILPAVIVPNMTTVNISKLNITFNRAFLNSSNLTFLNVSAQITLRGLSFSNPEPIIDFQDDGTFATCSSPQCSEISYSSGVFVFNVSSFTTYSSQETATPPTSIVACDIGFPVPPQIASSGNYAVNADLGPQSATCLNITASNVVLDCQGFNITGDGTTGAAGIFAQSVSNVTIQNCFIKGWETGIKAIDNIDDWIIRHNTLFNNTANVPFGADLTEDGGVYIGPATIGSGLPAIPNNNLLFNNTFLNNTYGLKLIEAENTTITSNIFRDQITSPLGGGIGMLQCGVNISNVRNNLFDDNAVVGAQTAIGRVNLNVFIDNNNFTNNPSGILSDAVFTGTIDNNFFTGATDAAKSRGLNVNITNNTFAFVTRGINVSGTNQTISTNHLYNIGSASTDYAIKLTSTFGNLVRFNNITNATIGVFLSGERNSTVLSNNLTNSTRAIVVNNVSLAQNSSSIPTLTGLSLPPGSRCEIFATAAVERAPRNIIEGNIIKGDGTLEGVRLGLTQHVTEQLVFNNTFFNLSTGVIIDVETNFSLVLQNTISNVVTGIAIINGTRNNATSNNITNITTGVLIRDSNRNNVLTNTISSAVIAAIRMQAPTSTNFIFGNVIRFSTLNGIEVSANTNETIQNNTVSNTFAGVNLTNTNTNTVTENTLFNNTYGIFLSNGTLNTMTSNTIYNNSLGIRLQSISDSNTISNNRIFNNSGASLVAAGISLEDSDSNTISSNNITQNYQSGIFIATSLSNTIFGNNILSNIINGIGFFGVSTGNNITRNRVESNAVGVNATTVTSVSNFIYDNLFNNTLNAMVQTSTANFFNVTYTCIAPNKNIAGGPVLAGNFWSSYPGADDGSGALFTNNLTLDYIGDSFLPHTVSGGITPNGDSIPLILVSDAFGSEIILGYEGSDTADLGSIPNPQPFTLSLPNEQIVDSVTFEASGRSRPKRPKSGLAFFPTAYAAQSLYFRITGAQDTQIMCLSAELARDGAVTASRPSVTNQDVCPAFSNAFIKDHASQSYNFRNDPSIPEPKLGALADSISADLEGGLGLLHKIGWHFYDPAVRICQAVTLADGVLDRGNITQLINIAGANSPDPGQNILVFSTSGQVLSFFAPNGTNVTQPKTDPLATFETSNLSLHVFLCADGNQNAICDVDPSDSLFHRYIAPEESFTASLLANGSVDGTLVGGTAYSNAQDIRYIDNGTRRSFLKVFGRLNESDVNASRLVINATGVKIAVNSTLLTGTNSGKTLFLPNNNQNQGIFFCPSAGSLDAVNESCTGAINFTGPFPQTSGGITVTVQPPGNYIFSQYAIDNATSSGAGLFNATCGAINGSVTLTGNVNSSGTCFTLQNDTTLDCSGFTIMGDGTGAAIEAANVLNLSIVNCRIVNFFAGVFFNTVTDSLVQNNTLINHSFGLYSTLGNNLRVNANTFNVVSQAVYFSLTNASNVTTNNFTSVDAALTIDDAVLNNIFNNTFNIVNVSLELVNNFNNTLNGTFAPDLIFTNTTFSNATNGTSGTARIAFTSNVAITTPTNPLGKIRVNLDRVFSNSTAISVFNTSADIELDNLTSTNPRPIVDFEDDGSFVTCDSPQCNEISYNITSGVFVFNVSSFTTYSSQETTPVNCSNVSSSIVLSSNLSSSGTCFSVNTSNIVIDCAGYKLTGSGTGAGVNVTGRTNVTVKNCIITTFAQDILFYEANSSLAMNNTLTVSGFSTWGIFLQNASGNNLTGNTISTSGTASRGIELFISSSANSITYNVIGTSGSGGHGIVIRETTDGNVVNFNNVTLASGGAGTYGILLETGSNATIRRNKVTVTDANGIGLTASSMSNRAESNDVIVAGDGIAGLRIGSSTSNNLTLNNITYLGGAGAGAFGIYLLGAHVNALDSNIVSLSEALGGLSDGYVGVYFSSAENNTLFNTTLVQTSDTWLFAASSPGNMINLTTFNGRNSSIKIFSNVTVPADENVSFANLNASFNSAFLNSSNLSFLNTSGEITLRGLSFTNPEPIVDFEDDGTFATCSSPQCSNVSYNITSGTFIFNVSSFTTYSSQETNVSPPPSGGGGGSCTATTWTCGAWSNCTSGSRTRTCVSNCLTTRVETEACVCYPNWNCTSFGACDSGAIRRTCTDLNSCGTSVGKPDESKECDIDKCKPKYECGIWGDCMYNNNPNEIFGGVKVYSGQKERICVDTNDCAENITESMNCTSGLQIEVKKEEICNRGVLTIVEKTRKIPLTSIDIASLKAKKLDVSFTQQKVQYCALCYDGIKDGFETGVDCGGDCRECKRESLLPVALLTGILLFIMLFSLIPISKMSREDSDLVEEIRRLIRSGEAALDRKDRTEAENDFRRMKWVYVQIESAGKKRIILKEMKKYHKKIKEFSEF